MQSGRNGSPDLATTEEGDKTMLKRFAIAAAAAGMLTSGVALAADEKDGLDTVTEQILGSITGDVTLATDYVFRGLSQTDSKPAVQGSIGFERGFEVAPDTTLRLYGNVWGSNVDFGPGTDESIELDYTAGFGVDWNNISADLFFIYYDYPGASDSDYHEFAGSLGYDFGFASVSGAVHYSPRFFGNSWYYTAGANVPLPFKFTIGGHVGRSDFQTAKNYTDWGLYVSRPLSIVDLKLAYYDTSLKDGVDCMANTCDSRVVFSASLSF